MLGRQFGNYRIIARLGEGGMGTVYLAEHPTIGRKIAIKVLRADVAKDQELVTRFLNEARAAAAIRHPSIIEIIDAGTTEDGLSYILMELLEGESLSTRLRRGKLRVSEAVELAMQATAALGAAHARGIIHRDLKPDNMFVVPDDFLPGRERLKILDFGIAKLRGPLGATSLKTQTGAVMGTPQYMSPEQCLGNRQIDHHTDIYSLGIILYEMLCGAAPFVSDGFGELIHLHMNVPPEPPRTRNPGIPVELEAVVLKALAKRPEDRFADAADLLAALRSVPAQTVVSAATPASAPAQPARPSTQVTTMKGSATEADGDDEVNTLIVGPRRRRAMLIGGAVALGAIGVVALLALRPSGGSPAAPGPAKPAAVSAVAPPAAAAIPAAPAVVPAVPDAGAPAAAAVPAAPAATAEPAAAPAVKDTKETEKARPARRRPAGGTRPKADPRML